MDRIVSAPPFRLVSVPAHARSGADACDDQAGDACLDDLDADSVSRSRLRLGDMHTHLHCSVLGTCLSTAELRKLMKKFIDVDGLSDLDLHHEAVRLTAEDPDVARTLGKALDRRHQASLLRFARAKDAPGLAELWKQSLKAGEVPGAYWAVLTHRRAPPELRQQAFGEVHMLSHLVGAANRADVRRLVALEHENTDLRARIDDQQLRLGDAVAERDAARSQAELLRGEVSRLELQCSSESSWREAAEVVALESAARLHAQRRLDAEARVQVLETENARLTQSLEEMQVHLEKLERELGIGELALRGVVAAAADVSPVFHDLLAGRRLLYVGGRPSSSNAIRDFVTRHGADYQRHDGGIEDRKGLLASALSWADLVVFPVDCIDHDSALQLKRTCIRLGTPFLPLRSANLASLAAGLIDRGAELSGNGAGSTRCMRQA